MNTSHATITVTDAGFESSVLKNEKPVLVDFWAPWCGPCRTLGRVLEELAAEYPNSLTVAKINVDEEHDVAGQLGVRSIPTMVLFHQGKAVEGIVGAQAKEAILKWLRKHVPLS